MPRARSRTAAKPAAGKKGATTTPRRSTSVLTNPPGGGKQKTAEKPKAQITVTLIPLGGRRKTVQVPEGSTVNKLLEVTDLSHKDGSVLVNSRNASGGTRLKAGDEVIFANKISGGSR